MDPGLDLEKMSFERNDNAKPFGNYEASAFRSTPGSNKLNMSLGSNLGTPIDFTESMKITGFIPKIKNTSTMFNSPGTSIIEDMKNNINGIYQNTSQLQNQYFASNLVVTPLDYLQKTAFPPPTQQPPVSDHIPEATCELKSETSEKTAKKTREKTESPNEDSMKGDSPRVAETDKREKNRVSAQKCRMRKKQYIESLEAQIAELNEELTRCKEEIKTLKELANLAAESNANKYQAKYKELIAALESSLNIKQNDKTIQQLISELNVSY